MILRRPLNKKPTQPRINRSHWLGQHVQVSINPNYQTQAYDIIRGQDGTPSGTIVLNDDSYSTTDANDESIDLGIVPFFDWDEATIFIRFIFNNATGGFGRLFGAQYSGGDDIRIYRNSTTNSFIVGWDDGTVTNHTFSSLTYGQEYIVLISHDGTTQYSALYDTVTNTMTSQSSADTFSFSGMGGSTYLFNSPSYTANRWYGDIFYCHVANIATLTDEQALQLFENEYDLYEPDQFYFPYVAPAAGTTLQSSLMMMGVGI